jgi:hypothetical protein
MSCNHPHTTTTHTMDMPVSFINKGEAVAFRATSTYDVEVYHAASEVQPEKLDRLDMYVLRGPTHFCCNSHSAPPSMIFEGAGAVHVIAKDAKAIVALAAFCQKSVFGA